MKLILACDPEGGIGKEGRLPWDRLNGDLARFKQLTYASSVIMGRNTWDSLPKKPLLGRLNIVVTSKELPISTGGVAVKRIEDLANIDQMWLIGGAKLVNSYWHLVNEIHLSVANTQYDCDTFIDLVALEKNYRLLSTEDCVDHQYRIYKR